MNKNILIILAVVLVAVIGIVVWLFQGQTRPVSESGVESAGTADETAAIQGEIESIDLGDLEKEFQSIDADLNSL